MLVLLFTEDSSSFRLPMNDGVHKISLLERMRFSKSNQKSVATTTSMMMMLMKHVQMVDTNNDQTNKQTNKQTKKQPMVTLIQVILASPPSAFNFSISDETGRSSPWCRMIAVK
jgi:1,4-alpha-glucan branching enzyme